MAQRSKRSDSPTLPLPPPRSRLTFEEFVETATAAAIRAGQAAGRPGGGGKTWPPRPIWVGIIVDPWGPGGPLSGGPGGAASE
jgi:hypothetical protein